MSHSKHQARRSSLVTDSFLGIESLPGNTDKQTAQKLDNFRVTKNGALEKRPGFKKLCTLAGEPVCINILRNTKSAYYICSDTVNLLDLESGASTEIAKLDTVSESAQLVAFKDRTLLFDGISPKEIGESVQNAEGYIPLYGSAWSPAGVGVVKEDFNLLTRRYRINYKALSGDMYFNLPVHTESVEGVTVNGDLLASSDYTLSPDGTYIRLSHELDDTAQTLTVYATRSESAEVSLPICRRVTSSGGENAVLYAFDPSDGSPYAYRSSFIDSSSLDPMTETIYKSGAGRDLYFPQSGKFLIGGGLDITSILPFSDFALVFSKNDAWLTDSKNSSPSVKLLNASVGCDSNTSSLLYKQTPITVCRNAIYRWDELDSKFNELSASCISSKLDTFIRSTLTGEISVISNPDANELWFFSPGGDTVVVVNLENDQWYTYSGFSPKLTFLFESRVYFTQGESLYSFDPSLEYDLPDGVTSAPIHSEYTSSWLDFGLPTLKKRFGSIGVVCLSASQDELHVSVELDRDHKFSYVLSCLESPLCPQLFVRRLPKARFNLARLSIISNSQRSQTLCKTVLYVRPSERVCLR